MARRRTLVVLEGVDELRAAFAKLEFHALAQAKEVVRESAEEMEGEAKVRAPISEPGSKGPDREPSGSTRDAIKIIYRDGGLAATIGTRYYVARFNEFGTVNMPAQPFLNPAFQIVRPKYLASLTIALNKAGQLAAVKDGSAR